MRPKVLLDKVGLWSTTAVASIALALNIAPTTAKAVTIPTEVTELGKNTYKKYCSACHGEEGHGDGPLARSMLPKPRDFTRGAYKFRTTPSGSLPTDNDIYRTISFGVPNSTMIPWLNFVNTVFNVNMFGHISEAYDAAMKEFFGIEPRPRTPGFPPI